MKELVLSAALFSLLICGVLCQDRSSSRYLPSEGDEDYDDSPPVNTPPPRRTQSRRGRPLPSRGQQHDEETQRHPSLNTRSPPASVSRNTHAEQSVPDSYAADRAPPPPRRLSPQRSPSHSRQHYGSEDSDRKSPLHQPEAHSEVSTAPPRPSRRRRPSKRLRNEKFSEGDDGVHDKPRTREHQPSRSSPRVLDDDAPRPHRYQVADDTFASGDMQRLPRPAPKQDQENKRTREKPRISPRPPHSRYTPAREDEDRPTQHLPIRRPVLEPQPGTNRLPPEEHEESHRGLPDTFHLSGPTHPHAPAEHSVTQQGRPYPDESGPPQIRPVINDNSYEVREESLPKVQNRPNVEVDLRQPQRTPYPTGENSGTHSSFKEQTVRNEHPDNRNYHRNSRVQLQNGSPETGPSLQRPDYPLKENVIHRTTDRVRNRNGSPQRADPSGISRRNPSHQQKESTDRNYDTTILKPNSAQGLRESTGRRVHPPSESEVRLPPNRQPLIAPNFDTKEEEPKLVSYHYQHIPPVPSSHFTDPKKDFEESHNKEFQGPSDRLPEAGNTERQPEFPQNAEGLPFTPGNFEIPHHLERQPGVEFADNVASLEATAEAEIDRQIHGSSHTHPPKPPSNRLPVENEEEEDSIAHIFPPPRLQHESQPNIRSPQDVREVRAPEVVRNTRVRQEARDSRSPQNLRDQKLPTDTRDLRSPQRLRESAVPHNVRDSRAQQNVRDTNRYREPLPSSSRSRYNKEEVPDTDTPNSQRLHRVGSRYQPENFEESNFDQRRASPPREETARSNGGNHHRSRPQYDGESRRSSPHSRSHRDPDEHLVHENQPSSPRDRRRQSYPPNTQSRNSENRRPHYNGPPERDQQRPTERRDQQQDAPRTNFKCPEPYGFYADHQQCDKYYECRNGTAVESLCMDGLAFNEVSAPKYLRCDSLRDVDCSSRSELQQPQPSKNCPRRFGLYPHETDCTKFWNCVDGAATEVQCPPGLVYSDSKATCDWADLVRNTCKSEDLLGFTCPEATSAELQDGVYSRYPHPSDCRLHFTCIKGVDGSRRPRMLSCNDGTVFDPQSGQCTRAENVSGCENYYGTPARSTKPQPSSEEVEDPEPKVSRRRRPNKRTRARAEERY